MKIKRFLFECAGMIAFIVALISFAITSLLTFYTLRGSELSLAVFGASLAFYYFVQQQKLAETQLLHQLIKEFNERYDGELNDALANIKKGDANNESYDGESDDALDKERAENNKLIDYFNLCAEEYLYYTLGYIPDDVWRSWCWGMWQYFEDQDTKIVKLWEKEKETKSYYGFDINEIKKVTKL